MRGSSSYLLLLIASILSIIFGEINDETFSCPEDLSQYRSELISTSFDPKKLDGMWYEIAYHDLAQVKESCQSYSRSVAADSKSMTEKFGFTYPGREPNALPLKIDFKDAAIGTYDRFVDAPFFNRLKLPSVVVDATLSKDKSTYETVSEFLCYKVGPISYREIRIGARTPTISDVQLQILEQNLRQSGVPFKELRKVDQSNCTYII
jgi:hypothetical protein